MREQVETEGYWELLQEPRKKQGGLDTALALVGVGPAVAQGTEAAGADAITSGWEKEGP